MGIVGYSGVLVTWTRSLAAVSASVVLASCAIHEDGQSMRAKKMGAMQEHPMHQMMQEMGCSHDPSEMQSMQKMTPDEKRARMMAHMQDCKAKMRQQAVNEAMAQIDRCIDERMGGRHSKRMSKKKLRAQMMVDLRACASQQQSAAMEPSEPSTREGH